MRRLTGLLTVTYMLILCPLYSVAGEVDDRAKDALDGALSGLKKSDKSTGPRVYEHRSEIVEAVTDDSDPFDGPPNKRGAVAKSKKGCACSVTGECTCGDDCQCGPNKRSVAVAQGNGCNGGQAAYYPQYQPQYNYAPQYQPQYAAPPVYAGGGGCNGGQQTGYGYASPQPQQYSQPSYYAPPAYQQPAYQPTYSYAPQPTYQQPSYYQVAQPAYYQPTYSYAPAYYTAAPRFGAGFSVGVGVGGGRALVCGPGGCR